MWCSDNSDKHDNSNEPVSLYIAPHWSNAVLFPQDISLNIFITPRDWDAEQVLFTFRGNGSLGYPSRKTRHSPSRHCNDDKNKSEEEFMEVSSVEEICGNRSLDTSHYSSSNCVGCESCWHRHQETSHSASSNCGGCGCGSSFTSHSFSRN